MNQVEQELSKKLLHAQDLGLKMLEMGLAQQQEIEHLKLRMDELGAQFETYCVANPKRNQGKSDCTAGDAEGERRGNQRL